MWNTSAAPAEDQRPFVGIGDRPDAVLAGRERLPTDHHVSAQCERRGRVGTGTPHLAPRHDSPPAEECPPPRARPVVDDRYLSRARRAESPWRAGSSGPAPPGPSAGGAPPPRAPRATAPPRPPLP